MGQKQSRETPLNKEIKDFFNNYDKFNKEYPVLRKKRLDIIDLNNIQIDTIQKYIKDIDNQINNKLIISSYINDYYEIKKQFLVIVEDYNNLNKIIPVQTQKVEENIEQIYKMYIKSLVDENYISNNANIINNELKLRFNVINDTTIESTRNQIDSKLLDFTSKYLNLKNSAQCNRSAWPNLYNDKCYSKCPIDSSFNIDSGIPVCIKIEKIKEDKTLNREVYKCPDGFFYKKEKNGKEVCISCPENYMYIQNTNGDDYCLENCPSEYVLDKDNNCKINKEYKLYHKENKQPEICPIGYSIKELNGNYNCIEDCPTGYVLDKDNICRPGYSPKEKSVCPLGYKLNKVNNQYICFEDCSENYKLEKNNICKYVNSYTPMISNYNIFDISCNNNDYDYVNGTCYKKCQQNYSTYSKDPTKCVIDTCIQPFERIEENNRIYCHQSQNKLFIPTYKNENYEIDSSVNYVEPDYKIGSPVENERKPVVIKPVEPDYKNVKAV
jgi:hypothetical protein